ncbi:hypothetical protein VTJ49DRAFT_6614 [Mycothermus thermophilus]|uniref:GPI inositol-deacylase n=1 Tax=Humicola insolens TaxID=85995 RepID=A0ABR3VJ46_HUMIN
MLRRKFLRRKAAGTIVVADPPPRAPSTPASLISRIEKSLTTTRLSSGSTAVAKDDTFGPTGLTLLHSPASEPLIDFIFVHGLGGGSRKTWSKTSSLHHFWPQQWLPLEPGFDSVRIHSYGYNCDWTKRKPDICNVHDFGKGLLAALDASPEPSATKIVLVGHSMGGGSDAAQTLKDILAVTGPSPAYISDLKRNSLSNQVINDTFRQYANDINIWSFYETLETPIGPIFNVLVVDRESAILGYPLERQVPMYADHRSIYIIGFLVGSEEREVAAIQKLQQDNKLCSYFFFRSGNKSSELSVCLRSLAYQMALLDPEVRSTLLSMSRQNVWFDKDDIRSVWRRLFDSGIVCGGSSSRRHYWVIDGIDECASDGFALSFLLDKLQGSAGLRVLITGRESPQLEKHIQALRIHDGRAVCVRISAPDTFLDIKALVHSEMEKRAIGDESHRAVLADKVLAKSNGSFLWTSLVLDRMASAHGREELNRMLDETPPEMETLYHETLASMSRLSVGKDLAKAILAWAACAVRSLTTAQLSQALYLDMKDHYGDLERSILSLCGQFVRIDMNGDVRMLHETARAFLLKKGLQSDFAVDNMAAHTRLASACLAALIDTQMRPPRTTRRWQTFLYDGAFVKYACEAFSDHLTLSDPSNEDLFQLVRKFLKTNVLTWIEVVAQGQNLGALTRAAKNLEKYLDASITMRSPLTEEEQTMRSWPTDLAHIAAKFGDALLAAPDAIHWVLLPFCPTESAIYKAASPGREFSIGGFSYRQWDDRLVSFNFHRGQTITAVCHGDHLFAVAVDTGMIILYHATSCQENLVLRHEERVQYVQFDDTTRFLASASRKSLRVWDVETGTQVHSFDLEHPLTGITFDGDKLLGPTHARHVAAWDLTNGSSLPHRQWRDSNGHDAPDWPPPCAVSISRGHRMMAVAYDGPPITLWDLEEESFYGKCGKGSLDGVTGSYYLVYDLVFNPNEDIPRLAVAYADGDLMLLEPFRNEVVARVPTNCHTLASSPDGRLLASGDCCGVIQIYDFETLRIIHRIRSAECNIKRLAFGGDGFRLLDIRSSQCNVWEPAALAKFSGPDTSRVETSATPGFVESVTDGHTSNISALFIHPNAKFAVCGKEDGSVTLYNVNKAEETRTLYKSPCFIRMFGWSDESSTLICVNGGNTVTAWRLERSPDDGDWNIAQTLIHTSVDCITAFACIHVHQASPKFVLSLRDWDFFWGIDTQGEEARLAAERHGLRAWADHPLSSDHVICLDGAVARIFSCHDWSQTAVVTMPATCGFGRPELHVKAIFPSANGRLLVEFAEDEGHQETSDMVVVDSSLFPLPGSVATEAGKKDIKFPQPTTSMEVSEHRAKDELPPILTYVEFVERVVHVLGVGRDCVIFVDVDSWVCSAKLYPKPGTEGGGAAAKCYRHFWVPYNWFPHTSRLLGGYIFQESEGKRP